MIIPEYMRPGSRYKKNDLKIIPSTFSLAKIDIAFASNGAEHMHKYFMQLLFPLLKPCHWAGSSTWAECSGEGWGAWLQPCSWGALLWWLHCGSPCLGYFYFYPTMAWPLGGRQRLWTEKLFHLHAQPHIHTQQHFWSSLDHYTGLGYLPRLIKDSTVAYNFLRKLP